MLTRQAYLSGTANWKPFPMPWLNASEPTYLEAAILTKFTLKQLPCESRKHFSDLYIQHEQGKSSSFSSQADNIPTGPDERLAHVAERALACFKLRVMGLDGGLERHCEPHLRAGTRDKSKGRRR